MLGLGAAREIACEGGQIGAPVSAASVTSAWSASQSARSAPCVSGGAARYPSVMTMSVTDWKTGLPSAGADRSMSTARFTTGRSKKRVAPRTVDERPTSASARSSTAD